MMQVVPISLNEANWFVRSHHRHSRPTYSNHRFCLGAVADGKLIGVAIIGRPACRTHDQHVVAEIARFMYGRHGQKCAVVSYRCVHARLPRNGISADSKFHSAT